MKKTRRIFIKKSALGLTGLALGAHNLRTSEIRSRLEVMSETYTDREDIDLLTDQSAWTTFSPRKEIISLFNKKPKDGVSGNAALIINGNNNAGSVGCWKRKLPVLYKDHTYSIEATFSVENVANISRSIRGIVNRNGVEYVDLNLTDKSNYLKRLCAEISCDQNESNLDICLYLIESENGTVQWAKVSIKDITDAWKPRLVRIAAILGQPVNPKTTADAIDFYCTSIYKINRKDLDLIVLGETINTDQVPGGLELLAEAVPGPSTNRLGEKAREYNTYIAAGLHEREGRSIYNTSVLIDRKGNVVGKYHKIHLTTGEQLKSGIKPGNDYPVFQTDFGKVGLMICFDNHYPEITRILSVKGADLIAHSNMGDGREWPNGPRGGVWEPYMRTRAIDNHVAIVSAVNQGRSCIVNGGEILAINKYSGEDRGGTILATVNLNSSVANYTGRSIQKRYMVWRRPETYAELTKHFWDFK